MNKEHSPSSTPSFILREPLFLEFSTSTRRDSIQTQLDGQPCLGRMGWISAVAELITYRGAVQAWLPRLVSYQNDVEQQKGGGFDWELESLTGPQVDVVGRWTWELVSPGCPREGSSAAPFVNDGPGISGLGDGFIFSQETSLKLAGRCGGAEYRSVSRDPTWLDDRGPWPCPNDDRLRSPAAALPLRSRHDRAKDKQLASEPDNALLIVRGFRPVLPTGCAKDGVRSTE